MILYREKDLDRAYKIDCRCRTKNNSPWIQREEFRTVYEDLMELYNQSAKKKAKYIVNLIEELIQSLSDDI